MAELEVVVQQQGMLLKQLSTKVNALNKRIDELMVPPYMITKDETPAEPYKAEPKKKAAITNESVAKKDAPVRTCSICKRDVFLIWHKRHEAKCKIDDPCNTGVVING